MILFKKQLFDLEVKSQGPTKVIMVEMSKFLDSETVQLGDLML
jgi:hypothetical protein